MAEGKARSRSVSQRPDNSMECRRCKSRHTAHRHSLDTDEGVVPGRGRVKARVIREGVARWTFPSRTPPRPPPYTRGWQRAHPWSLQLHHVGDYSVPDMEGVVSEELRHRIERVLSFPIGGDQGEESTTETTPTNGQEEDRTPAGGLLQDFLDQLEPEGEDDDELLFQGSESEESEGDLLYDPEKETYTTPYLLFLQHKGTRRRDHQALQAGILEDDSPKDEEEEDEGGKTTEDGREGAMGRSGYRSSVPTTSRTLTNSKEPPTSASNSKEPPTSTSSSKEPPTPISDDDFDLQDQPEDPNVHTRRVSRDQNDEGEKSYIHVEDRKDTSEQQVGFSEEVEGEVMPDTEESGLVTQRSQKKKKKKKKKKGSHGEPAVEETEEEIHRNKLEELKTSIGLQLFRDFIKNVYAKDHPEFRLFESFEELDKSQDSDVLKPAVDS
ncbi:ABC transporter F family member 4-like [Homarus americanus]|uniref:RGS domain-containing protein n=1 Tax=Homarus americanus TaxID=6706 RepID=A0A8J5NBU2_HOMAM|nr:ABC transporter F family member 4-like [Homarus americanus]KAG7176353.1 hypothetical protein Hamer_G009149 [Homarus americanus]